MIANVTVVLWAVGDVVQLKSGGPAMTVTARIDGKFSEGHPLCRCMFFAAERMNEVLVPEAALEAVERKDG